MWARRFIVSLILFVSAGLVAGAAPRDPAVYFFDQTLGDLRDDLQTAREEGKQGILLFFEQDECPFCHRMKQTILNQRQVQDYYKEHFLIFPVDIEGDVEITDFEGESLSEKDFAFQKNRVRATPVFAFYDLDGKQVARYTGAASSVEEFLWLGEFVVDGHYKNQSFTRFKREKKRAAQGR